VEISFASPAGALVGLAGVLPLAAVFEIERRARRVRRLLHLGTPATSTTLGYVIATAAIAILVALAATQPVIAASEPRLIRSNVEIYMVLDTSRSMLAASAAGAETRLQRALGAASELRESLPDVPLGIASITDRLLPHLFPTTDGAAFATTLAKAVGIDRPPPRDARRRATALGILSDAATWNFFSEDAARRLLVVFTDGEGRPSDPADLAAGLRGQPSLEILPVHVWSEDERVFGQSGPEPQYTPDPTSRTLLENVAAVGRGRVFAEDERAALEETLRERIESAGRRSEDAVAGRPRPLAPFAIMAAFLPLGFLLWRRTRT